MRRLNSEPPPNYQQTSIAQILKADREVWIFMAQNVADVRPSADGTRPLDRALHEALADYNLFPFLLLVHMLRCATKMSTTKTTALVAEILVTKGRMHLEKGKASPKV